MNHDDLSFGAPDSPTTEEAAEVRPAVVAPADQPVAWETVAISLALEALRANNKWHIDYDDYGGYDDSALQQQNLAAMHALETALAAPASPIAQAEQPRNPQPDGGYPGCDVCACPPGVCHQNECSPSTMCAITCRRVSDATPAAPPAPAAEGLQPVAWLVTRLRRKGDESSGRCRYLHLEERTARSDYDGWLEVEGASPTIAPLYATPPVAPAEPQPLAVPDEPKPDFWVHDDADRRGVRRCFTSVQHWQQNTSTGEAFAVYTRETLMRAINAAKREAHKARIAAAAAPAVAPPNPMIRDALERLQHIDAEIWDDITAALEQAAVDHCSPDCDELDCALLLDLVRLYRTHPATGGAA